MFVGPCWLTSRSCLRKTKWECKTLPRTCIKSQFPENNSTDQQHTYLTLARLNQQAPHSLEPSLLPFWFMLTAALYFISPPQINLFFPPSATNRWSSPSILCGLFHLSSKGIFPCFGLTTLIGIAWAAAAVVSATTEALRPASLQWRISTAFVNFYQICFRGSH